MPAVHGAAWWCSRQLPARSTVHMVFSGAVFQSPASRARSDRKLYSSTPRSDSIGAKQSHDQLGDGHGRWNDRNRGWAIATTETFSEFRFPPPSPGPPSLLRHRKNKSHSDPWNRYSFEWDLKRRIENWAA